MTICMIMKNDTQHNDTQQNDICTTTLSIKTS
jgi:hypothetical protein